MALADRQPPTSRQRILTIDLERLPGELTMDVWEPRDFRRINYVHPDRWTQLPSTLCASAKWLDSPRMMFAAAWDQPDDPHHVARWAWNLYNEADAVITFNGNRADNRWLASDWVVAGLTPPSPWKSIDLYVTARRQFAFESKSLRHLCDRLGLPNKWGHYSAADAKAAMAGDERARKRMKRYNAQDVRITEAAAERLGPWIGEWPHVGLSNGLERCCWRCGSEALTADGLTNTAVTSYALLRCECGAWNRLTHRKHNVATRRAR